MSRWIATLAVVVAWSVVAGEVWAQPPGGGKARGPGGRGRGPAEAGSPGSLEKAPLPKDDGEKKILDAMEQITREQGYRLNVPTTDGRMLRLLAESIDAKKVVEFGTSNGVSGLWWSLALRKTGGKLITHEISPETAALARKNFALAGVTDLITVVEGDGHEMAKKLTGPIDIVFIDADKEGYLDYFNKTLPLVRPGGLICAHNVAANMPDQGFLKAITTDPNLETLFYRDGGGLSITLKKR
jgi:caffeoyl-CoA O-methyltransferase